MKKIVLLLFALFTLSANSQTSTLAKTYGVTNMTPAGILVKSIVYGNSLFNVYNEGTLGLMVQKNDLNGVPVLKRNIAGIFPSPMTSFYLNTNGGNLYISGSKTNSNVVAFLIKIDTATCNFIYSNQYTLPSLNMFRVYDTKIMNNGTLIMAGSATNSGSLTNEYGVLMTVNTTSGAVNNTKTLTVNGATNNVVSSLTDISNSSIIFVANGNGTPFLGKAINMAGNFTVTAAYGGLSGSVKVNSFANPKKFFAHNATHVYKIDTNMTTLFNPQPGVNMASGATLTHYMDNKVYRFLSNARLEIVDSALVVTGSNNYTSVITPTALTEQSIAKNANNLFVYYSANSTTQNFQMVKTALNGTMNCSSNVPTNPVSSPINGGSVAIASGFDNPIMMPSNPNSPTIAVTYTDACMNTGLEALRNENTVKVANINGNYQLTSLKNISSFQMIDLTGKIIRNDKLSNESNSLFIDMENLPQGIYIVRIKDMDKSDYTLKLIK